VDGIGLCPGKRGVTAWVKFGLPHGATYQGKVYGAGKSIEIKLGRLESWSWSQMETRRDELRGRAERNEPLEEVGLVSFDSFATAWLDRAKVRSRSWRTSKFAIDHSLIPYFGPKPISGIAVGDVNRWQAEQLKRANARSKTATLSPAYVRRQFNTLRAIMSDAVRNGLIEKNPCSTAESLGPMPARRHYLTNEQATALVAHANVLDGWLGDYVEWLLHSGMRPSEPLRLRWDQVLENPDGRAFVLLENTKNGRARPVTCSKTMKAILDRQHARKKENDDRVFPIVPVTLRRRVVSLRKNSGFEALRLHDLRRTNITHLVHAGVDLRSLQGRVGHSDLSMFEKHYAIPLGDAEAADRADEVFS